VEIAGHSTRVRAGVEVMGGQILDMSSGDAVQGQRAGHGRQTQLGAIAIEADGDLVLDAAIVWRIGKLAPQGRAAQRARRQ
jgi:hypothetical protein